MPNVNSRRRYPHRAGPRSAKLWLKQQRSQRHRELPYRRHLHSSLQQACGAGPKSGQGERVRPADGPLGNGLQLHRIDKSKDPNFWSARVNRDVRLIVYKTEGSMLVAYVDHHDNAYAWAERRRIEAHPRTGAVQIVEVRERVEEMAPP
jgi:hypothetical protein